MISGHLKTSHKSFLLSEIQTIESLNYLKCLPNDELMVIYTTSETAGTSPSPARECKIEIWCLQSDKVKKSLKFYTSENLSTYNCLKTSFDYLFLFSKATNIIRFISLVKNPSNELREQNISSTINEKEDKFFLSLIFPKTTRKIFKKWFIFEEQQLFVFLHYQTDQRDIVLEEEDFKDKKIMISVKVFYFDKLTETFAPIKSHSTAIRFNSKRPYHFTKLNSTNKIGFIKSGYRRTLVFSVLNIFKGIKNYKINLSTLTKPIEIQNTALSNVPNGEAKKIGLMLLKETGKGKFFFFAYRNDSKFLAGELNIKGEQSVVSVRITPLEGKVKHISKLTFKRHCGTFYYVVEKWLEYYNNTIYEYNFLNGQNRILEEWTDIYGIIKPKDFKNFLRYKRYIDEDELENEQEMNNTLKILKFKQVYFKTADYHTRLTLIWIFKRINLHKMYNRYVLNEAINFFF